MTPPDEAEIHVRLRQTVASLPLTRRQASVVEHVALGWNVERIGEHLDIKVATVRAHLRTAFQRLQVGSRTQLVALLMRMVLDENDSSTGWN